jgi:hypothetical protein
MTNTVNDSLDPETIQAVEVDRSDAELLGIETPPEGDDAHMHEINKYALSHLFEATVEWINAAAGKDFIYFKKKRKKYITPIMYYTFCKT